MTAHHIAAKFDALKTERDALLLKLTSCEHERLLDAKLLENVRGHWERNVAQLESKLDAAQKEREEISLRCAKWENRISELKEENESLASKLDAAQKGWYECFRKLESFGEVF